MKPEIKYIRKLLISELCELIDTKLMESEVVKIESRDLKQDLTAAVDRVLNHYAAEMLAIELLSAKVAERLRRSFGGGAV